MGAGRHLALAAVVVAFAVVAGRAAASAPPVGPLPKGPTSTITTSSGQLVAVALPHRSGGRVWRIARAFDSSVLTESSEGDLGNNVLIVFATHHAGTTKVVFALTRGERPTAYESRTFVVHVR